LWDAVASSPLPVGQMVVVRQIDGLLLQVDAIGATATASAPATAAV
jgi:hypothetical protein